MFKQEVFYNPQILQKRTKQMMLKDHLQFHPAEAVMKDHLLKRPPTDTAHYELSENDQISSSNNPSGSQDVPTADTEPSEVLPRRINQAAITHQVHLVLKKSQLMHHPPSQLRTIKRLSAVALQNLKKAPVTHNPLSLLILQPSIHRAFLVMRDPSLQWLVKMKA